MNSKIGVGIIGFGFSAKTFHLPYLNVLESFDVKKIVSRQTGGNLDDLWDDQFIDLVIITSPNHLHFEHAYAALSHRKHVLVEKPFVLTESEGRALIDLATQQQKILTVFQNRRWDADFLTLQKLIQEGALGEIFYFESRYDRFRPEVKNRWKEGGVPGAGILWDWGSHLIDQTCLLFGPPTQVFADCAIQRPGGKATDYFEILLDYPSGLKVSLGASNLCLKPGPRFVVHGTRGSFIKFGADPQEACLIQNGYEPSADWGRENKVNYGTLSTIEPGGVMKTCPLPSESGRYQTFYDRLAAAIREHLPPPVDAKSSLEVIKLIQLCDESATQKRRLAVPGNLQTD